MAGAIVQENFGQQNPGTGSYDLTLPNPTTTGNFLVAIYWDYYADDTNTGRDWYANSDPGGDNDAMTSAGYEGEGLDNLGCEFFYLPITTGLDTHTVRFSRDVPSRSCYARFIVMEIEGLAAAPFDQQVGQDNAASGTTYSSGVSGTTAQAEEYLLGAVLTLYGMNFTPGGDEGFTTRYTHDDGFGLTHCEINDANVTDGPSTYELTGSTDSTPSVRVNNYLLLLKLPTTGGGAYSITGSGGAATSGATVPITGRVQPAAGGATTSGSTVATAGRVQPAAGGATTAGTAVATAGRVQPATGGATASGAVVTLAGRVQPISGGLTTGGAADQSGTAARAAALSGTILTITSETDLLTSGRTIILTLTGDTWVT